MAVYFKDNPVLFEDALASVFLNTLLPTEVLLVIDGNVGGCLQTIISKYVSENGVKILQLPQNIGLANALNEGLKIIHTEWVVRADSDDVNLTNRFEVLSHYMNNDWDLVGSQILEVDAKTTLEFFRKVPLQTEEIRRFAKKRNPFNHMTVAYRTAYVKSCGGYPDIYLKEDYGLWVKMISKGAKVINIDKILVRVNAGEDMYQRRGGVKYAFAEIKLQRHLIEYKINNYFEGLIYGLLRSSVHLMPILLRSIIYKNILRN